MVERQDEMTWIPSEVPAPWEKQLSPLKDQTYSLAKLQDKWNDRKSNSDLPSSS